MWLFFVNGVCGCVCGCVKCVCVMLYKDMSRGGSLEVRTRGSSFGKMLRAE